MEPNLPTLTKKEIDKRYNALIAEEEEADSLSILAPSKSKLKKRSKGKGVGKSSDVFCITTRSQLDDVLVPEEPKKPKESSRDSGIGLDTSPLTLAIADCHRQVQAYQNELDELRKSNMDQGSQTFIDDETRKMSLIRLEMEKAKIFQDELEKKEEKKRREKEEVRSIFVFKLYF